MSLFKELKRRNVLRVGAAYVVAAWLVIQVVETIFPVYGLSDASIRIVITVLAIGLIPSLIFAWAFELTPQGLIKESEVDRSKPVTPHTGKKLDRIIMVVLALALGYFAFDKFVLSESREATIADQAREEGRTEALVESYGEKSIAVLAFVDMSEDGDQEYMSDGIAEELLNLLAKIPDLRVISRSSAFSFKGKDLEIPEIAERLNVAHILEGSIRKAGNQLRITTQLIEARSDTHLWSETYDRELKDIFAIQDEIASMVVDQLKISLLGGKPKAAETDPKAYTLYLEARHASLQGSDEANRRSEVLIREALSIDPEFPVAWVNLSILYQRQALRGLVPADEGFIKAREAAEQALVVDPDYLEAYIVLGSIVRNYDNDLAGAAKLYERGLRSSSPNPISVGNASILLLNLGRVDEAIAAMKYYAERDPMLPTAHFNLGNMYRLDGRWDQAIASYENTLKLAPEFSSAHYGVGVALLFKGEPAAALERIQKVETEHSRLAGRAMALHMLGHLDASNEVLTDLTTKHGEKRPAAVASVLAFRDEPDRAFKWLEKAVAGNQPGLTAIVGYPEFRNLHDDPRWLPFLESIGKSPAQLADIEFEMKLPN